MDIYASRSGRARVIKRNYGEISHSLSQANAVRKTAVIHPALRHLNSNPFNRDMNYLVKMVI